jgi:hypothetical protein
VSLDDALSWAAAQHRESPAPPEVEAVVGPAVFLVGRLGNSAYLALDGRVVGWAAADGHPPAVIDDPDQAGRLLVIAAHELRQPGLLALLPPVPEGMRVCPACDGSRWDFTPEPNYPDGRVCFICKARGWLKPP